MLTVHSRRAGVFTAPRLLTIPLLLALLLSLAGRCLAGDRVASYNKDGLSFHYPAGWKLEDKLYFPYTMRALTVTPPKPSSQTSFYIEMFYKPEMLRDTSYHRYDSSLKAFAKRFNKVDLGPFAIKPVRPRQSFIQRGKWRGLKDVRSVDIPDVMHVILVREYYRMDTRDQIVFVILNTNKKEYPRSDPAFAGFLTSLHYRPPATTPR